MPARFLNLMSFVLVFLCVFINSCKLSFNKDNKLEIIASSVPFCLKCDQ